MFAEKLLELVEVTPVILAFLSIFWKGDEVLAKDFRRDISAWLQREPINSELNFAVVVTENLFHKLFGEHAINFVFIFRSILVTVITGAILSAYTILANIQNQSLISHFTNNAFTIFLTLVAINSIVDYLSLIETKFLLRYMRKTKFVFLILFIDFLLTSLIYFGGVALYVSIIESESFTESLSNMLDFAALKTDGDVKFFTVELRVEQVFIFISLATTYFTSIWIWGAAIGSWTLRLNSNTYKFFRFLAYATPMDEKPVRTIGLVGIIATLVVFSIILLFQLER